MANNCNEACTSSCESTCKESCAQKCSGTCSNLCDNVCTYVCRNVCTSSCESMCGDSCDETCISKCSGTSMSITNIETFYDRGYARKVTKLTNTSNNGYFIYPGLNGNITVFKVANNFLMGRLATAMYNERIHGGLDVYNVHPLATEDSEHMQFDEKYMAGPHNEVEWSYLLHDTDLHDKEKDYSAFSILEIQRVTYDALMRSIHDDTEPLELEDVLYLIYRDPTIRKLYYDIQGWSWNNTDSYHHNLIKKQTSPAITKPKESNR